MDIKAQESIKHHILREKFKKLQPWSLPRLSSFGLQESSPKEARKGGKKTKQMVFTMKNAKSKVLNLRET